jgi:hypothetical protein
VNIFTVPICTWHLRKDSAFMHTCAECQVSMQTRCSKIIFKRKLETIKKESVAGIPNLV